MAVNGFDWFYWHKVILQSKTIREICQPGHGHHTFGMFVGYVRIVRVAVLPLVLLARRGNGCQGLGAFHELTCCRCRFR
jgi:hypothetical protein